MAGDLKKMSVLKRVLQAGTRFVEFSTGSKVQFHFVTKLLDGTIIDNSREMEPMELILGKQFKLEVWELIVQNMSLNEISSFIVDKQHLAAYPFVSKTLRDRNKPKGEKRHHCCGVTLQNEGLGYEDLNKLMKEPCDLIFEIELLSVYSPEGYKKESWQMSDEEKLEEVPNLRDEGNLLYREGKVSQACELYFQGIGYLEQLLLKEKPHDTEWANLMKLKLPLLLNYSQCKLLEKDYYPVIEHCSFVLQHEPDNLKALFRRAKAHVGVWNVSEAKADFERVVKLDPSLANSVKRELRELEELVRKRNAEDRAVLAGKLFQS